MIEIRDLHFTYNKDDSHRIEALRGINLDLDAGTFLAIVGANGSGKTTLARHLNALLVPDRGWVRVAGRDTRNQTDWPAIRADVTMVFQRPEDQIVATTVEDDIAFGPENLQIPPDEIDDRVRWALKIVGMWDLRQRPPHLLSAGQQQRVAIAGALAMRPRCLVLDEATAMLDPAGRRALLSILRRLHAEGMTVVLITHFMNELSFAERVIVLDEGRITFDGPPRRLFSQKDRLASWGLEPTPIITLTAELAQRWPGFPADLLTVDELAAALRSRLPRNGQGSAPRRDLHPPSDDPALIVVNDLHHVYLAGTPLATAALNGINLKVHQGEVLALLGPTGSGKSSLLQNIAGLLQPSSGKVTINRETANPSHPARQPPEQTAAHQLVGMLFQRPEEQLFETYVGDDVAFGPRQLGLDREAVRERVHWAMETSGLPFAAFKDRFTQSLSSGEKRKAALAGVLALCPQILLLDEPTAGLDPRSRRGLLSTLRRLSHQEDITLIVATHAMEDVAALANRAVVLEVGQVVANGTPRQLFGEPGLLVRHGLDVPEVTALMHRLWETGSAVPTDVLTVEQAVVVLGGGLDA